MELTTAGREVPFEVSAEVAGALGRTVAELRAAEVDPLAAPAVDGIATVGIWRVRGADWSAVVKVLRHVVDGGLSVWRSEDDPAHPFCWRREADAGRPVEESAPLWVACGDFLVELAHLALQDGPSTDPRRSPGA